MPKFSGSGVGVAGLSFVGREPDEIRVCGMSVEKVSNEKKTEPMAHGNKKKRRADM